MKHARLLWGFFVLAGTCFGQGIPYFSNVFTSANSAPPGSQTTMFTVPFSTVTVCGAVPVGNPCTNTVVIYANATMTVTARNPITTDVHGKFNFWAPSGSYSYSLKSANGTLLGTYYFTLGGSGGTSVSFQHNGTAVGNQNVVNFDDTTPAAPTGFVNVIFQNDSTGKWSAYVPIGGSSFSLTTTGTGPATYASSILNIPDYTYTLTVPKVTALGTLTNDISGSAAKWATITASGVPGVGQVPVATSSTTASWQTISATGGLTGQTINCAPKAQTATTSASSMPVCDDGTTTTIAHPVSVNDGTGNAGLVAVKQGTAPSTAANSIGLTAPASVTAYNFKFPGAQGTGCLSNDGSGNGSWAACSGGGGATVASSETVASSATPTFSTSFNVSYNVLTANVTTFTLAAGSDGQAKTLTFCQNGTGGFTVTPPANVHGFFTVSPTASKCNSQHFNYSTAQTAWLADSAGVIGE